MPAAVEFETIPQLVNQLAVRYSGSSRVALGYKEKKVNQWVDLKWDALAEQAHSFAGYLHT